MKLLAIDTSTRRVVAALGDERGVIAQAEFPQVVSEDGLRSSRRHAAPRHVEQLVPGIKQLMTDSGVALTEVDVVAVTTGPGMFTGLRVGIVTACTIAMSLNVGVVEVSSLEALSYPFRDSQYDWIVSVLDARRAEVYDAIYRRTPSGCELIGEYNIEAPSLLVQRLENIDGRVLLCGDGALRFRDVFSAASTYEFADESDPFPTADALVALGRDRWRAGALVDPMDVRPLYLRPSDAEINASVVAGGWA